MRWDAWVRKNAVWILAALFVLTLGLCIWAASMFDGMMVGGFDWCTVNGSHHQYGGCD